MACPVCSGHEAVGKDAAAALKKILRHSLDCDATLPHHIRTELMNIVNMIDNAVQRAAEAAVDDDPLLA